MESTLKRTWAEIDLDALAHNYKTLRAHVGETVRFLGVVKADAYGHGSVRVSRVLQELGADYLAVSSIDEAMELRVNGITMPILILGHTPKEQVGKLMDHGITQAVTCKAKAVEYDEAAAAHVAEKKARGEWKNTDAERLKVHIKVDTGMSRLGFLCYGEPNEDGIDGIEYTCRCEHLEAEGIFTHFAVSDEEGEANVAYTKKQFELFMQVIRETEKRWGHQFALKHCANTGATARYPETRLDMVRPGLLLYGYGSYAAELGLKPVMSLKTTISTIKTYPAGTTVSYGRIFTTDRVTRLGVVPYGYADGFFRCLSNRYDLLTSDGPAPVRGKICMDMCMIDLTDLPAVKVGDEVEIFGPGNSIDRMADMAGTISYELCCAVSKRVPRMYYYGGKLIDRELMLRG